LINDGEGTDCSSIEFDCELGTIDDNESSIRCFFFIGSSSIDEKPFNVEDLIINFNGDELDCILDNFVEESIDLFDRKGSLGIRITIGSRFSLFVYPF